MKILKFLGIQPTIWSTESDGHFAVSSFGHTGHLRGQNQKSEFISDLPVMLCNRILLPNEKIDRLPSWDTVLFKNRTEGFL